MAESERVQIIRRGYAAFNRGDVDAVLEWLDDQIEWRPPPFSLEPEPIRGHGGVRKYLMPDLFDEQTAEPQEFIEEGDRVLVVVRVRARGRESGIDVAQTVFHIWTLAGARAVRFEAHTEREQALAALRGEASCS